MDPISKSPVKPTSKYYGIWETILRGEEYREPVPPSEVPAKRAVWWACLNKRGVPLTAHYDKKLEMFCIKRWTPEDN